MGRPSIRMAAFLTVVLTAAAAGAEEQKSTRLIISPQVIQHGIGRAQQGAPLAPRLSGSPRPRTSSANTGRRVLWTAVGAAGGFFAGGYLGAAIENAVSPCGCDDPGLKGALIGIPIGAIAGGVAGFALSR